jgi:superfamily II DNA helicase RecQ
MDAELEQARHTATHLAALQRDYYLYLLTELFDFKTLDWDFRRVLRILDEHLYKVYPLLLKMYKEAAEKFASEITAVSGTFYRQYAALVMQSADYAADTHLAERIGKAATYFAERLDELLKPLIERTRLDSDNQEIKERIGEAVYALQQSYAQKSYLLARVMAHGFSIATYLKDKAIGLLNAEQTTKRKRQRNETLGDEAGEKKGQGDIRHPRLFHHLRQWRAQRAEELGRPVYGVLTQKSLIAIVNERPISGQELLRIPGIGKTTLQQFGKEILAIVQEYVDEW